MNAKKKKNIYNNIIERDSFQFCCLKNKRDSSCEKIWSQIEILFSLLYLVVLPLYVLKREEEIFYKKNNI